MRLYDIWVQMRARCNNPNHFAYKDYGGRGIKVDDEWNSFPIFCKWSLENGYDETAPRGQCTLDRIDNNGNYCTVNCQWITNFEQQQNKRSNHYLEYNGKRMKIVDWARELGINQMTIRSRLFRDLPIDEVLSVDVKNTQ